MTKLEKFVFVFVLSLLLPYCNHVRAETEGSDTIVGCFVPGECDRSLILDTVENVSSPEQCAEACEGFAGCKYFTHYQVLVFQAAGETVKWCGINFPPKIESRETKMLLNSQRTRVIFPRRTSIFFHSPQLVQTPILIGVLKPGKQRRAPKFKINETRKISSSRRK